MNNRLYNSYCYLCGGMDRMNDGGITWRKKITPFLQQRGIVVLDPTNKPIDKGLEGVQERKNRHKLLEGGQIDKLADQMRLLRIIDLRMCDKSDFLIVYIDIHTHLCGTYEELFSANSQKRPILIMIEGGITNTPMWLFGVVPKEMIFGSWDDLLEYVRHVDEDEDVNHYRRWTWFQYDKMLPQ